jgi:hypothetical protein
MRPDVPRGRILTRTEDIFMTTTSVVAPPARLDRDVRPHAVTLTVGPEPCPSADAGAARWSAVAWARRLVAALGRPGPVRSEDPASVRRALEASRAARASLDKYLTVRSTSGPLY